MSTSDRPTAPAPLAANIPDELKARAQWVLWRYEWVINKQGIGKWTKVPYGVRGHKAATTRPTSWQSFASALERYHADRDYFDGIGYVFADDDPYVGGDQDHDLSLERIPPTYAEISPSGGGVKFIARATGHYGRKTVRGELYSSKRFFTITGNVLPGREQIADCQAEVEAFYKSLGGRERKAGGASANGDRAKLAADIPESEWEAGRQLLRTQGDRLIARVTAAGKEGTQLALLLAGEYAEFHKKWPVVGLYRGDGSLDQSQVRAVAARNIKVRGFTFPEFAAIISRLYSASALDKWGTKELWRQELAALWNWAPAPKYQWQPKKTKVKRGRAGNHAELVDQVYSLLLDRRTDDTVIVKTSEIAGVIGCHRRTIITILDELQAAGRIGERKQLGQHGGVRIPILGVIYSDQSAAALPQVDAPNDAPPVAPIEETKQLCVSSDQAPTDHTTPTLADLAAHYLDTRPADIGQQCVNKHTGQVTYRRTAKHFARLVVAEYPYTFDQALDAYAAEQQHRKELVAAEWRRFFDQLRAMPDDQLVGYIGGRCKTEVAEMARDGSTFDRHLYATRLKCARRELKKRGLKMPTRKTRIAQAAQEDAARAQAARQRPKVRPVACQPIRYERAPEAPTEGTLASLLAGIRRYHEAAQKR